MDTMDKAYSISQKVMSKILAEAFPWGILLLANASGTDLLKNQRFVSSIADIGGKYSKKYDFEKRSMHPAIAEIVGQRLMTLLGIGCSSSVRICDEATAVDRKDWVIKEISRDGARVVYNPSFKVPVLLISRIKRAVPVSYLRRCYRVKGEPWSFAYRKEFRRLAALCGEHGPQPKKTLTVPELLFFGKRELFGSDFYSDFCPPPDWQQIRRAINWDSAALLKIHAARVFLAATTAHASNILVDGDARVYSIDHEHCACPDGYELEQMFEKVRPDTPAFDALRAVAQLSEEQVASLFTGLADIRADWCYWPLGSQPTTAKYYADRLRLWKRLLTARRHES